MTDVDFASIAALRRKHAATHEPAKRAELANTLRAAGFDPDASPAPSAAPEGRTAPVKQTTAQTQPVATAEAPPAAPVSKETSNVSDDNPASARRRPARPRKTETSK